MSFVKVWIHAVWGTKNREPILQKTIRDKVIQHIVDNAKSKGIYIDCINGYAEHLHCLMLQNSELSIAKHMQLIKGESSFWINKQKIIKGHFEWADEYFAISVSDDKSLDAVREYIVGQEVHHKKVTFMEEYEKFIKRYGFNKG